jgi:toxin YoeB
MKFLEELQENPRYGTGQPERLKYFGEQEVWSRRPNKKDRMVYSVYEEKQEVDVHYCRGHYD